MREALPSAPPHAWLDSDPAKSDDVRLRGTSMYFSMSFGDFLGVIGIGLGIVGLLPLFAKKRWSAWLEKGIFRLIFIAALVVFVVFQVFRISKEHIESRTRNALSEEILNALGRPKTFDQLAARASAGPGIVVDSLEDLRREGRIVAKSTSLMLDSTIENASISHDVYDVTLYSLPYANHHYNIAIVLNEDVPHIQDITGGFVSEFRSRGGVFQNIARSVGDPSKVDTPKTRSAFEDVLGQTAEKPDVLVTIGTGVSQYAKRNYPKQNRYFIGVTDPVAAGLVGSEEVTRRSENIAGYNNGVDLQTMVKRTLLCFRSSKIGFVFNPKLEQDVATLALFKAANHDVKEIEAHEGNVEIPQDLDLVIGWGWLKTHIVEYTKGNPRIPFVAPQVENMIQGVVAGYGSDYSRLGQRAAAFLFERHLRMQTRLGELPIQYPRLDKFVLYQQQVRQLGLQVSPECDAERVDL